eukprot:3245117-Pyramimonas_sp.AAC.1
MRRLRKARHRDWLCPQCVTQGHLVMIIGVIGKKTHANGRQLLKTSIIHHDCSSHETREWYANITINCTRVLFHGFIRCHLVTTSSLSFNVIRHSVHGELALVDEAAADIAIRYVEPTVAHLPAQR